MYFNGIVIAIITFLTIGIFHPIVIKCEYYFSCRCWPIFLICGVLFVGGSLFVEHAVFSSILGVIGCSCLWSIKEPFEQRERVRKGWFPKNPKHSSTQNITNDNDLTETKR